MESFESLHKEFEKKLVELQAKCLHKKTSWAEHYWALAHSSGYEVRVCDRCHKIVEEKPTKEEREKADKEWFKEQEEKQKRGECYDGRRK